MKVTLTSPVEGKQPGEVVDVESGRAKWLVDNGYGYLDDQPEDYGRTATSVPAKDDPTLAENVDKPEKPKVAPRAAAKKAEKEPVTEK